ncbi:MAG: RluA family pseudouridine synthase [Pirellulaceae bacterium]
MAKPGIFVFHVTQREDRAPLLTALRGWMEDQSWGQLRRLVSARRIQVNGNLCVDEGRRLTTGEVVRVLPHSVAPPPRDDDVRLVFVDAHVVVLEKPAGITTLRHSEEQGWPHRRKDRQPTLDEILPRVLAKSQRQGTRSRTRRTRDPRLPRVRAVHRLDRDTSGVMVFARSAEAERALVQQFRHHTIHRQYLAIVHGSPVAGTIRTHLVRDRGDGRRGSTTQTELGQLAVTHVRPLERLGDYTLIACRLETGRTHQIRIHLAEAGHFLCGDKVYCQPLFQKPLPDTSGAPRIALHAAELEFDHPITGERLSFRSPLPPDLKEFLQRLRKQARGRGDAAGRQP